MRVVALAALFAGAFLVVGSGSTASPAASPGVLASPAATVSRAPAPGTVIPAATLTEVVQQYCVVCHNDQLLTGNLSLQAMDVDRAAQNAETAERMIRKLRAGMMPPPGIPRPGGDTLLALVETLESNVDKATRSGANVGSRRFQRLTRAEYERVVADLLDLQVDASQWLPVDILMGSFDNQSAAQAFSTSLVDSFLRAATEISRLAIGNAGAASVTSKYLNSELNSQNAWDRIEGAPFGSRGGMVVTHAFPADGEYVFQAVTGGGGGNKIMYEDLDISIDGEPVALLKLEENGGNATAHQTGPIFVRAGQHRVSAAFVNQVEGPYEDRFGPAPSSAAGRGGVGTTALTKLDEFRITGPNNTAGVSETASRRRVFSCTPKSAAEERPCAQAILTRLATQAHRRPEPVPAVADLMKLYDEAAAKEGFEVGVRTGLQAILVSPDFLFRLERVPDAVRPGETYRLDAVDLATRLSFFLWSTQPDQELLKDAASGELSKPAVLERQVRRMLKDPKAEALATRFAYQWLRLQDVGEVWPRADFYPSFSKQLAHDMVSETELLFQHLVQEDRSFLELFNADYTYLNDRLAKHYGVDGVIGDEFRKVQYPAGDPRRGIFGHGSMLQSTSMSDRTSPVLRGKWVMEVLMGTPPPPPPPNVPAFDASPNAAGGRRLTTRERMEAHRASPVCNSCHRFIDPIGLALDNFDAVGQWRIRENMTPLDTRGEFYDGTPVTNPSELAAVLLKRPIPLARNFTEHMLSYALGRPTGYTDQPTIRAIVRAAEPSDYRISSLIMGVVKSDVFQMRQAPATAN